jgi:predicted AlkP superfamily phosphohydrolase/phosphomutase
VERVADGYVIDVDNFRTTDKEDLLRRVYAKTDKHFRVARHLVQTRPSDFFMMVEMGVDRMHHAFWSYCDPAHHKYQPGNPLESTLRDYYAYVDRQVGDLLSLAPRDTAVLVVSDHGAKRIDGGICVNEWLRREGYLVLKEAPAEPTRFTPDMVDWARTAAWGEGGYYARISLNVAGREPEGTVAANDYDALREELKAGLEALGDDKGRPIGTVVHRPEDLYPEQRGIPPDLLVYFGDLFWRSIGQVGMGAVHVFENDTGPDDANHASEGLYLIAARGIESGAGEERDLRDIAPTLLTLLGEPVPPEMEGRSLV